MKLHMVPFDCEARFVWSTWGFVLRFRGNKGADGQGDEVIVDIHCSPSWLDHIVQKLKEMFVKQQAAVAETQNTFKL